MARYRTSLGNARQGGGGRFIDLTGEKFTRLVVIGVSEKSKPKYLAWECICDCGKTVHATRAHLMSGVTKSCGCYKADQSRAKRKLDYAKATEIRSAHAKGVTIAQLAKDYRVSATQIANIIKGLSHNA